MPQKTKKNDSGQINYIKMRNRTNLWRVKIIPHFYVRSYGLFFMFFMVGLECIIDPNYIQSLTIPH